MAEQQGAAAAAACGKRGKKRSRMHNGSENYVCISCFDEPDRLVEVDRSLLGSFDCRLSALVRNTAPSTDRQGREFFRAGSGMTRAMLLTMIKSLTLGELVICKGVTVGEALKVFEFEGIGVSGFKTPVQHPSMGLAFTKREERVSESVHAICERVADAIVSWPRLETTMDHVILTPRQDAGDLSSASSFTATATRAWVRFADRPKNEQEGRDFALSLVTKNPRWLAEGLVSVGVFQHRISQYDPLFAKARDEASFKALWKAVESDPLGTFCSVRTDVCKSGVDPKLKKELNKGERFYSEIRNIILQSADAPDSTSTQLQYARAIITLVENLKVTAPNCSRIFSGACADESGCTPERTALKRALKARGVTVVRWTETRDPQIRPIVFPPSWRDANSSCYGPCVLLGFENLL